jgi:drug/metabolite transporter (DMT)-like permease
MAENSTQGRHDGLGIGIALTSAVGFAMSNATIGLAYAAGANPLAAAVSRFFIPILLLVLVLKIAGRPILMPRRDGIAAFILGIVTAGYTIALLTALSILPVGIVILVFYLFPIFTAFIVAAMRWAPLSPWTIGAAAIAFAGLTLALGVRFEDYSPLGIGLAALSGFGLAVVSAVSGRVIAGGDARQATLYMAAGALITLGVSVPFTDGLDLPNTTNGWIGLSIAHLFYAGAMIGYFFAISRIGSTITTIFSNIEPIVAITAAFFILGQELAPLQLVGAAVVVGALFLAMRAKPTGAH